MNEAYSFLSAPSVFPPMEIDVRGMCFGQISWCKVSVTRSKAALVMSGIMYKI